MNIQTFIERRIEELAQQAAAASDMPKPITRWPEKRPPWEPEQWAVDQFGDLITVNGAFAPMMVDPSSGGLRSDAVAVHVAQFDPAWVTQLCRMLRCMVASLRLAHYIDDDTLDETRFHDDLRPLARMWRTHADFDPEWEWAA